MVKRIVGGVLILAGVGCGALAYLSAGGQHGYREFQVGRLFGDESRTWLAGAVVLLFLGVLTVREKRVRDQR